jgi:uncharacterized protein
MIRVIIYVVLLIFVLRALNGLWGGIMEGLGAAPRSGTGGVPASGVHMVRDPVCGTFVVPGRALSLAVGRDILYFCSTRCRDAYRARPGARRVEGRTA